MLPEVTTISPNIVAMGGILETGVNDKVSIIPSPTQPASIENIAAIIFLKSILSAL